MKLLGAFIAGLSMAIISSAAAQDAQLTEGKEVYDKWCIICHGENNPASGGGTATLMVLYKDTDIPAELEDRTDMSPELIESTVRWGRQAMPNFRITEITHSQLEALVAYLTRNNP